MASTKSYLLAKRALDVIVAVVALILLSPILLLISIAVRIESPGPALFRQSRLGKHGRPFLIYKFRTMTHNAPAVRNSDGSYFVGKNDPRLTRCGRFLREHSLDELPQFINVLRGEMSLVGPRPDQEADLALYDDFLAPKLTVKPGLTSLASVNGRNLLTWRQRTEWERYYVEHRSMALDLKIIWKTLGVALLQKGIYYPAPTRRPNND
jgi:undecaprenyl phosphate N,N'-diacetylbacillosamine 1-phosphate transferase